MTSETKGQATSIVDGTTEWTAHELYKMIPDQMLAFVQNVETQPAHVLKKLLELMSKDTSRLDGRTASVMGGRHDIRAWNPSSENNSSDRTETIDMGSPAVLYEQH